MRARGCVAPRVLYCRGACMLLTRSRRPNTCRRVRPQGSKFPGRLAAGSPVGSGWMDMPESTPLPEDIQVFPRLKERDPYK